MFLLLSSGSLENRIQHYAKKRRIELIDHDEAAQRKLDLANGCPSNKHSNNDNMSTD